MINAIAIDDELPALKIIESFCGQINFINLKKTFNKPTEALKYLEKFPIDLLFLDINMPALSGIDLYKSIPQKTSVIFTTAYSEYAVEGFNLSAADYILKPFSFERFQQAVTKAQKLLQYQHNHKQPEKSTLVLRVNYSLLKINTSDILFIEGLDDYLKINIVNGKPVIVRMTMKAILQKLSSLSFIRVHKSFIINMHAINSVRNKNILIHNTSIPLGSSYEEGFYKLFNH